MAWVGDVVGDKPTSYADSPTLLHLIVYVSYVGVAPAAFWNVVGAPRHRRPQAEPARGSQSRTLGSAHR